MMPPHGWIGHPRPMLTEKTDPDVEVALSWSTKIVADGVASEITPLLPVGTSLRGVIIIR